jgi:hypothetical protein
MVNLKSVRPPRVNVNTEKGSFWKQIGMIIIGTTISLAFTLIAAQLTEKHQRAKDRRLSAMMVMSNIEIFSRLMDDYSAYLAPADSVATWLLGKPLEELELMPEEELNSLIDQVTSLPFMSHDKSAENIFSNNIETWKNMGNVAFISIAGQCFSTMNSVEEYWNKWATDLNETILDIKDHPDHYEGSTMPIKILRSEKVRRSLKGIHYWRAWLSHVAATIRYNNQKNMESIGIEEQKVMDYTNELSLALEDSKNAEPDFSDFYSSPLNPDSLTTLHDLDIRLKELIGEGDQLHK